MSGPQPEGAEEQPATVEASGGESAPAGLTARLRRRFAALAGEARSLRWRPYPFEIAAWVGLVAAVTFLRSRGLRIDWVTVEYTIYPLFPVIAKSFWIGILMFAVFTLVRRRSVPDYFRRILTLSWVVLTIRLWAAIVVFAYTYVWLKVCVPLVNQRLWDPLLWRLDTLIHLGFSPSVFAVELLQGTGLLRWIDLWYMWWIPSVSFTIAFFCAFPEARVRRRFVLSAVVIWTLGACLYTAVPVLGPIYASGEVWQEAVQEMPHASQAQALLMDNYQKVIAGRTGGLRQFNPTRGIAALPSLHVGIHCLFTLWMWRYLRPLFAIGLLGTFFTFVGSVATGWHYAVDGYVGIVLAWLAYWVALKLEPDDAAMGNRAGSGAAEQGRLPDTTGC